MALTPGTKLGSYEISSVLGAGGMGEVYRARDAKLGRDVAIKILSSDMASDPDRLARFRREARTLASLSHPNIGVIYDLQESGSTSFLVLEVIEGDTLADRISRSAIPWKEAAAIAKQIADALDAAHEKGIVHRDLKPANIKITPEGVVKVLDFGLAKSASDEMASQLSNSPTVMSVRSEAGVILGTAAYMSPEQARGKTVDKRTDIWAFGCVLYEMLTGRQTFSGETVSDLISVVLQKEPDWSLLPAEIPASFQRLLRRCLAKNPSERLRDVADARMEIVEAIANPSGANAATESRTWRQSWPFVVIVVLVAVLVAVALRPNKSPDGPLLRFSIPFPPGITSLGGLVVSPQGDKVAFVGALGSTNRHQLFVRRLDAIEAQIVTGAEEGISPVWSPDGQSLVFSIGDSLKKITPGNLPTTICSIKGWSLIASGWTQGTILLTATPSLPDSKATPEIYAVADSGGNPSKLAVHDPSGVAAWRATLQFLPDGKRFLYSTSGGTHVQQDLYWASLDSLDGHLLLSNVDSASYANGQIVYVQGNTLVAQPFDPVRMEMKGGASPLAGNASLGWVRSTSGFSTSANGVLTYQPARQGIDGRLVWFDRSGKELGIIAQPIGEELLNPVISPDGNRLAVNRMDPQTGNWDVWTTDLTKGTRSRLTSGSGQNSDPVWSPDGEWIAFISTRNGRWGIYRKRSDGSGEEELLSEVNQAVAEVSLTDWSKDGRFILFDTFGVVEASEWALPLFGDRTAVLLYSPSGAYNYGAHISPNGKWIAYSSDDSGQAELYVRRFMAPGEKKQISRNGGIHPRWRNDGKELFFWGEAVQIMAASFAESAGTLQAGTPYPALPPSIQMLGLADLRSHYDVTGDGQRFLLRRPNGAPGAPIQVILNWPKLLPH